MCILGILKSTCYKTSHYLLVQSAGVVEYTDCIFAEG